MQNINSQTTEITLASGRKIIIRESNGEDEGVLSTQSDLENGRNIPGFLARVIVDETGWKNPYTAADIMLWPINDKYHALLASRIHSLGHIMKFKWEFEDDKDKFPTLVEDLNNYNWDFSKGLPPQPGDENFFFERIKAYPLGSQLSVEVMLSSKKQIRYSILNSLGENKVLARDKNQLNRNDALIIRNLEWLNEQNIWQIVENFNIFSSREMQEIRANIEKNDPSFTMKMELKSPKGAVTYVPLIYIPDFFFPGEIL